MDILGNLALGLGVATTPINLLFCFIGAVLGTLVGVLPGISPLGTVAMVLPLTFYLDPVTGLMMLAGIYYGAQYGGSTTAILVALPGEASSVVTALDGYALAKKGRAGAALAISALGSFFAGTVSTGIIFFFAPLLTAIAREFGPAEYFSLMVFGLISSVVLAQGAPAKAIAMVLLGLLLGLLGTDLNTGVQRYTFGSLDLLDGLEFLSIAMGMFGLADIIFNLGQNERRGVPTKITRLWPTRSEIKAAWPATLRGTAIGSLLGVLPGGGAILSSFAAYALEKKISKTPERFGTGMIAGVAAPESANNAGAQTSFIPLLTLGIPSNALMALLLGAMMVHGITPGPDVIKTQPALFWGLIASMWLGNLMLVIINLPLVGVWVSLLRVPYRMLFPAILIFSCIGVYGVSNQSLDVCAMAFFGLFGFIFLKLGCEPAPMLLGFILGPLMEENMRRALLISRGNPEIFVNTPISGAMLLASLALLVIMILPAIRKKREKIFAE